MPRNIERDAELEKVRRKNLIDAGFELFSKHDIESVSLQAVADEAGVGIATLYNYYGNKVNLVIAISAEIWNSVWKKNLENHKDSKEKQLTAYEYIDRYCSTIIEIYSRKPEILRFSANYKTFIRRQKIDDDTLREHLVVLDPVWDCFNGAYERAKIDKSIRVDIPEREMFSTIALTMLSTAERYAQGLVWADSPEDEKLKELNNIKEMLLDWSIKNK